jgi:hypothetical protein
LNVRSSVIKKQEGATSSLNVKESQELLAFSY